MYIELMKLLPFSLAERELLLQGLKSRVNTQYYVNRKIDEDFVERMFTKAEKIILKCKELVRNLREEEIENIRELLKR